MSNQQKKTMIFRVLGAVFTTIGLVLSIIGFANFFANIRGDEFPKLFWLAFVGIPLLAVGGMLLLVGFWPEFSAKRIEKLLPKMKELQQEMAPIADELAASADAAKITCECGKINSSSSKYCSNCGKELVKSCPNCKQPVDSNAKFCNACGSKIE